MITHIFIALAGYIFVIQHCIQQWQRAQMRPADIKRSVEVNEIADQRARQAAHNDNGGDDRRRRAEIRGASQRVLH